MTLFPDGFSDAGMTGYRKPRLSLYPDSLVSGQGTMTLILTVTSTVTLPGTTKTFYLTEFNSQLTLDMYNSCQGQTNACSTCQCKFATALAPTEPTCP